MTKEILFILACVPLYVVNSFCDKLASQKNAPFYYNFLKFLIGSVCLLPLFFLDTAPKFMWGALLCGALCGVFYAISKTVILKGYEKTSVAFMTFCHASGMILPCIIGAIFWQERLGFLPILGILLAIFSIVLLKDSPKGASRLDYAGLALGGIIFATSGGVMVVQKLMGLYFADQSNSAYNFYSFAVAFLLLGAFTAQKKQICDKASQKPLLLFALGSALSLCTISLVMTSLAGAVPSVILFPLFNGLGIVCVCLGSAVLFKERLTRRKCIGLVLGLLGLCLINF